MTLVLLKSICSIADCSELMRGRGWCVRHYNYWLRHGTPVYDYDATMLGSILSRIKPSSTGCLLWQGSLTNGYGKVIVYSKQYMIHRYMYERMNGPIPDGFQIDHLCRVRNCVNTTHLEVVTPKENYLRGFGVGAINARKTHCIHGHPFSGDNLHLSTRKDSVRRTCATCRKRRSSEQTERRREAAAKENDDEVS